MFRSVLAGLANILTGFRATTAKEYADGFTKALALFPEEALAMRYRARKNSLRFSEEVFSSAWNTELDGLVGLRLSGQQ